MVRLLQLTGSCSVFEKDQELCLNVGRITETLSLQH